MDWKVNDIKKSHTVQTSTGTACTTNGVCEHAQLIPLLSTLKSLKYDSLREEDTALKQRLGRYYSSVPEILVKWTQLRGCRKLTELRA